MHRHLPPLRAPRSSSDLRHPSAPPRRRWGPLFAAGALVLSSVAAAPLLDREATPSSPTEAVAAEVGATAPVPLPTIAADSADAAPGSTGSPLIVVPRLGSGDWAASDRLLPSTTAQGDVFRVAIRVEDNLPVDVDEATASIMETLQDAQGWQGLDDVRFELVTDPVATDTTISIASPSTVDAMCAPLNTRGEVSCRNGTDVVLNAKRWIYGVDHFPSLEQYRQYLVNHEVGHALGHGHARCPAPGATAPLMQQQTGDLRGCVANAWPAAA